MGSSHIQVRLAQQWISSLAMETEKASEMSDFCFKLVWLLRSTVMSCLTAVSYPTRTCTYDWRKYIHPSDHLNLPQNNLLQTKAAWKCLHFHRNLTIFPQIITGTDMKPVLSSKPRHVLRNDIYWQKWRTDWLTMRKSHWLWKSGSKVIVTTLLPFCIIQAIASDFIQEVPGLNLGQATR